jgi:Flp pilus assembly protein TadG
MREWKENFAAAMVKLRRLAVEDAGANVLEMALSSAILFSLFFGVFEVALGSYTSHYVADAAREGARYAIVRGSKSCINTPSLSNCNASPTTIATYVKGLRYPAIVPANMTVNVTYMTGTTDTSTGQTLTTWAACSSGTCNVPNNMVNVAVTYAFPLTIPFVPKKTINVSSTSQMVVQQ